MDRDKVLVLNTSYKIQGRWIADLSKEEKFVFQVWDSLMDDFVSRINFRCMIVTYCKVTGRRHRVSPCRSAYFSSPWWLLTLDL